ncbi:hypothetical protein AAG570_001585, partial [Ranatra chinensis]
RTLFAEDAVDLIAESRKKRVAGRVLVFGDGVAGQLGLGEDVTEKGRPAPIPGLDSVIEVAAGGMHTVCLTADYKVITFGCNDEGALGRDTSEEGSEFNPAEVEVPGKVVDICAGDSHTAALLDNGTVYVWGTFRDSHGSMGLLSKSIEKKPVLVSTDVKILKIASGSHHLMMLGADGQLYSCGCAEQGQLGRVSERGASRDCRKGLGPLLIPTLVPFSVHSKLHFDNVWTGSFSTFTREKHTGEIYVFGLNNYTQIGLDSGGVHFWPKMSKSFSGTNWVKISGGEHHTVAMDSNGCVYTLGRKEYGRLGLGENSEDAKKPTKIESLGEKCLDVVCGSFVTFAIDREGKLYSWGMGSAQLGLGAEEDTFVPAQVKSKQLEGKTVVRVSSGGQHTVVIVTDGQLPS